MVKASEKYPCLKKIKKNQLNIIRFPFFYNARADKLYLKIIDNLKKKIVKPNRSNSRNK